MARIDNDETKDIATPFLILAHVRTGGTFCAHALSNHPSVFCDRGEVMHHASIWRKAKIKPDRLMVMLWNQTGYFASGFRLIYRQAFHEKVWPTIQKVQPKIIHLQRRSLLRQALSYAYQQQVRGRNLEYHPVHSFRERDVPQATMDLDYAAYAVKRIASERKRGHDRLKKEFDGEYIEVFYEDMVRGGAGGSVQEMNPRERARVCQFLGVDNVPLRVDLKREFPVPLWEMFGNWTALRERLAREGWGYNVEQEENSWTQVDGRWVLGE